MLWHGTRQAPVVEVVSRGLSFSEVEKVTVSPGKEETLKRGDSGRIIKTVQYVPPESKTVVVRHVDGHTTVKVTHRGVCFSPGVAGYVSRPCRLSLDVKLAYWQRWGVVVGLPVTQLMHGWDGPYVAASYNIYKGTGLFLGYAPLASKPIFGLRVSF